MGEIWSKSNYSSGTCLTPGALPENVSADPIIKYQLGLQVAHSQQSEISSVFCVAQNFSLPGLHLDQKRKSSRKGFGFIPLCPFLPCLGFISAVSCEGCALRHPGALLSQEPAGADCFQAACGSTCADQACV